MLTSTKLSPLFSNKPQETRTTYPAELYVPVFDQLGLSRGISTFYVESYMWALVTFCLTLVIKDKMMFIILFKKRKRMCLLGWDLASKETLWPYYTNAFWGLAGY